MTVGIIELKLYAPWVQSLKEKRMVVKSIMAKARNKFNISVAEIDEQDTHKTIVIGISIVSINKVDCEKLLNKVIDFIESNTEAELLDAQIEII